MAEATLSLEGRTHVWFSDPFAGRNAMLSGFQGRKAAKPWLKALRAVAHSRRIDTYGSASTGRPARRS